jgi:3-oxoadipate enol-lactonase
MAMAEVNGTRIAYSDSGGERPAVVLAHGYLMDRTMWQPYVEALAPDWRVVTFDARGFGGTRAAGSFDYWDVADDVLGLLDHLGIERAVIGGMSQGGFIAMRVALRAPGRVAGLVLIDTQAHAEDPATTPSYDLLHATWVEQGPRPVQETIAFLLLGPGDWPYYFSMWAELDREQFTLGYRCLMDRDSLLERLPEIACPALIVHGKQDGAIPLARAEAVRDGLSGLARLLAIEGGTHGCVLTHAPVLSAAMGDFLRALESESSLA